MSNVVIKVKNLNYRVPYGDKILSDISFELLKGTFTGLLGRNGAGKTTLMDIFLGIRNHYTGVVEILKENPSLSDRNEAHRIAFLSNDIHLDNRLLVSQFLDFHANFFQNYSVEFENELLEYFQVNRNQKIGALSTGQRKKIEIIAAFSGRPEIILIDEITAVLDPETRLLFFNKLVEFKNRYNTTILVATNIHHDLTKVCDSVLFLTKNKITNHTPSEIDRLFNIGEVA